MVGIEAIIAIIGILFAGGGIVGVLKLVSDNWRSLADELAERITVLNKSVDAQEARNVRLTQRIDDQIERMHDQVARLITLEAKEREAKRRIVELERTEREQASHIAALSQRVATLTQGVDRLIKQIKDAGLKPVWTPDYQRNSNRGEE